MMGLTFRNLGDKSKWALFVGTVALTGWFYLRDRHGGALGFVETRATTISVVEMGGASVASDDNRVTEAAVRGFWKAYRGYMGL